MNTAKTLVSLPMLNLATATREDVLAYFRNGWEINETLFSSLEEDESFYAVPDKLRHPLIFYITHPAVFYINKLREAGLLTEGINAHFERIFAVGVDEMSWDDYGRDPTEWPSVTDARLYRQQVKAKMEEVIMSAPFTSPITWDQPYWAIPMGMEHERIHIETSSVLLRQMPLAALAHPPRWPAYAPLGNEETIENELIEVPDGVVELGKPSDFPSYGWDNEYGRRHVTVPAFRASKYLITNKEFLAFVEAGGYETQKYWSDEGWRWRTFREARCPTFWVPQPDGSYKYRAIFAEIEMPCNWPADVNQLEAKAYCSWKGEGFRVITEAEWHRLRGDTPSELKGQPEADPIMRKESIGNYNLRFSSSTPVNMFAPSPMGFHDVHGNTWEWAEDEADGLPGFKVHPYYLDFSTPCFDGRHNLIMGGSWVSTGDQASAYARYWFRRHFFQHLGFRLVQTIRPISLNLYPIGDNPHKVTENRWIDESNVYEQKKLIEEYLQLHYGRDDEVLPYPFTGLGELALNFPRRCAQELSEAFKKYSPNASAAADRATALELGCAVGRASFELARTFSSVVGLDYSRAFVNAGIALQEKGVLPYKYATEGRLLASSTAEVAPDIDRARVNFMHGDACSLPKTFGAYDAVLLANLLDRLPAPSKCLEVLPHLVKPGGVMLITSPYTWLEQFTHPSKWMGGYHLGDKEVRTFDVLKETLQADFELLEHKDMPLLIREHVRKFQLCVAHATVWRRK